MTKYPFLTALRGRGGTTWTGAPLSWLRVEAKGERLYISGTTPLVDDGERFIQNGAAYSYMLEGEDAEKLLASLSKHPGKRPETVIAETFEFSRPDYLLKEYIDDLGIRYEYHSSSGEIIS